MNSRLHYGFRKTLGGAADEVVYSKTQKVASTSRSSERRLQYGKLKKTKTKPT